MPIVVRENRESFGQFIEAMRLSFNILSKPEVRRPAARSGALVPSILPAGQWPAKTLPQPTGPEEVVPAVEKPLKRRRRTQVRL